MPNLVIDPLCDHRDLIEHTVDWHLPEFDAGGERDRWLDARTEEASQRSGVPCAWVAFFDGEPVGSVSLIACNMETRQDLTPWLAALYVLPERRGRGVGAALTRRCEVEAEMARFDRMFLYTSRARDYYRRLGWIRIAEDFYEGQRVTVMLKNLPQSPSIDRRTSR